MVASRLAANFHLLPNERDKIMEASSEEQNQNDTSERKLARQLPSIGPVTDWR